MYSADHSVEFCVGHRLKDLLPEHVGAQHQVVKVARTEAADVADKVGHPIVARGAKYANQGRRGYGRCPQDLN